MEENYIKGYVNGSAECTPNYEEQIAKELQWLKDAGATIKVVEVPEELRLFSLQLSYEQVKQHPYEVIIADSMPMWTVLDTLMTSKDVISRIQRKEMETVNTKELLKKLDI